MRKFLLARLRLVASIVLAVLPAGCNRAEPWRLVDMDEIDRGMLGLYLSTQPLAA